MSAHGGRTFRNFGDELSRRVVAEVTGRRIRWAPPESAHATAIGSVLEHVAAVDGPGVIWGTGLRRSEFPPSRWAASRPSRFLAVRGKQTRDALGLPADTPLGDPGLIARTIFPRGRRARGVVVVPHFLAFNSWEARRQMAAARSLGFRVVAPSSSYGTVCDELSRAELVLTSSLHGMVVADALDRPAQLVSFGPTTEPALKFTDYQSVFGLSAEFVSFTHDILRGEIESVLEAANWRREVVAARLDDVVEGLVQSGKAMADLG